MCPNDPNKRLVLQGAFRESTDSVFATRAAHVNSHALLQRTRETISLVIFCSDGNRSLPINFPHSFRGNGFSFYSQLISTVNNGFCSKHRDNGSVRTDNSLDQDEVKQMFKQLVG
jgi:hypothetical protein